MIDNSIFNAVTKQSHNNNDNNSLVKHDKLG